MAKFNALVPNELIKQFQELNLGSTDMLKKMTRAGATVVYRNVKNNMNRAFDKKSGDLEKSLVMTKTYKNSKDEVATKVGFYGYDKNNVPNPLKALAREYGTSKGEKKIPFLRPAFKKAEIEKAMLTEQEKYIPKE